MGDIGVGEFISRNLNLCEIHELLSRAPHPVISLEISEMANLCNPT